MKFKKLLILIILTIFVDSCVRTKSIKVEPNEIINVEYPEAYELANIILALTEYGKTDKWEVRKGFDYYNKVLEYFKPVKEHPLLDKVNYSRERWKEYLSFRTDAYAFEFDDNNQLIRKFDFYANKGVQPFDDYLNLINDFVQKSNFRKFFRQNKNYYDTVSDKYKKTQYLKEMRDFLTEEFGTQYSSEEKYNIVLSPFVYRMNCHRDIDSMNTADFITIPNYVLSDTISTNKKNIATSIHNLFTEMDHGYVNPTTNQYKELVVKKFDANLWGNKSGYNESSGFGVFNEYMTWAVYDIFLKKHFPNFAKEIGLNWSFQNDSRGFIYSQLFTQQLLKIYNQKGERETLKDLYPKLLEWTFQTQNNLSKPKIISPKDSTYIEFSDKAKMTILFSESMKKADTITTILQDGKRFKQIINLNSSKNNLIWSENGKKVEFEINLPNSRSAYYLQFNWWGAKHPLISEKGVLIKSSSYFKVIDK